MKKYINYFLAFLIPFVVIFIVFCMKGLLKSADYLYVSDLRVQHIAFFVYLKHVLLGKASILYSFTAGMGGTMLSTLVFYCVSPLNVLLLIIKDIQYAVILIFIIKVGLAGLNMYIFLNNKKKNSDICTVAFSSCYALCSFVLGYFYCVFWFDTIYLAPLVLYGIDKIFKKKKFNLVYIFSLGIAIMCNIQMGFCLCIFSLIYFIYSFNIKYSIKKDFKKFVDYSIIFGVSSLCAGAISSGALLAFMSEYNNISIARNIIVSTKSGNAGILGIIKVLLSVGNYKNNYYNNDIPYLYSSLVVSFFSVMYFFDKKINKKKKTHGFIVILIFLISFLVKPVNLFWHMSEPILLNFRYSIYLILFLIMLAYEYYCNTSKLKKRDFIVMTVILSIGIFIISLYSSDMFVSLTSIFLIITYGIVFLFKYYNKNKVFKFLLFLLIIVELSVSSYLSIYSAVQLPVPGYVDYDSFMDVVSKNKLDESYRVTYNYSYTDKSSDSLMINRNSSLRYFSSVINGNVNKFFEKNYTFVGGNNYRVSAYESPLLLSLLGNKYIYDVHIYKNSLYKKIDEYKTSTLDYMDLERKDVKVYLYDNPYALSLGYMVEEDAKYDENMDIYTYQNEIIKKFTGYKDGVLDRIDFDEINSLDLCQASKYPSCRVYYLSNKSNNANYYVYASISSYRFFGSDNVNSYLDVNVPLLISTLDDEFDLVIEAKQILNYAKFEVFTYNEQRLIKAIDKLKENMLYDININKNELTGKIDAKKSGKLFLSIPYEKRFNIYVDGKKVEHYKMLDGTFMGIDIKKGNHKIRIVYQDNRIYLYTFLTIISIIISFLICRHSNKKRIDSEKYLTKLGSKAKEYNDKLLKGYQLFESVINKYISSNKRLYFVISIISLSLFIRIYGYNVLVPTNINWIFFEKNEVMQHYVGWKAYRLSHWSFPFGLTNLLSYPSYVSVIHTDSIPILAFIFKLLSGILPYNFQYFGFYNALCFVLNGVFAAKIIKKYTNSKLIIIVVAILFNFLPTMIFRMFFHTSLASHYLILLSLSTIFLYSEYDNKRIYLIWGLLAFLTSTIHIYFIAICGIVLVGYMILDILNTKSIKRSFIILIEYLFISLLFIWLFGGFVNNSGNDIYGLGDFSLNLNSFIDPRGYSIFLKDLSSYFSQYEGYSYLGLGIILMVIISIIIFVIWYIRDNNIIKRYKYLMIVLILISLLSIFIALSPKAYFGGYLLYNLKLPRFIKNMWGLFRSTGRFVWPCMYIIIFVSAIVIIKRLRPCYALIVILLCTIIQIVDLSDSLEKRYDYYAENIELSEKYDLSKNKLLNKINKIHEIKYLIFVDGNTKIENIDVVLYSNWAIDNNIKTNNFHFARKNIEKLLNDDVSRYLTNFNGENLYMFFNKKECNKYDLYCYKLPDGYYLGYINEIK